MLHASNNEFIELYNPCSAAVDVTGWVVDYHTTAGTSALLLATLMHPIAANGFVVLGQTAFTGTADYRYTTSLSGNNGGVRLSQSAMGMMMDSMSYGAQPTTMNPYTQGAPAPYAGDVTPAHSTARKVDGVSTGNNSADFAETSTPTPGLPNRITP